MALSPSTRTWKSQESALVIARLLLPQIFEKMAMHEIRVLVAERSTMNIYIKGEDIELEQNYIGILLEGFLKTRNQNLITPPGVLLPSSTDLSLFGLESSGIQAVLSPSSNSLDRKKKGGEEWHSVFSCLQP